MTYRVTVFDRGYIKQTRMNVKGVPTMTIEDFKHKTGATDREVAEILGISKSSVEKKRYGICETRIVEQVALAAYYHNALAKK